MVGRYPDNPTSRETGLPTEQRLEIGPSDGEISPNITTVQKDTLVLQVRYENCCKCNKN